MKKIILIIICFLFLMGCSSKEDRYKKIMEENNYIIIDVRTKEEYEEGHVKDSINIPYDEIDSTIEINKDLKVFVYCKSGKRSSIAYTTLTKLGYDVYDLGAYDSINLEKE